MKTKPEYRDLREAEITSDLIARVGTECGFYQKLSSGFNLPPLPPVEAGLFFEITIPEIGPCAVDLVIRDEEGAIQGRRNQVNKYAWRLTVYFEAGGVGWEPPYTDEAVLVPHAHSLAEAVIRARHEMELKALDDATQSIALDEQYKNDMVGIS